MDNQIEGYDAIVVAIDKDKNSLHAVKWAVDNIVKSHNVVILIHVRTQSSQNQESNYPLPKKGVPPTDAEMQQFFLPYRGFCARKGIRTQDVVLHDIEIQNALLEYISDNSIGTIVLGASTRNVLMRHFRQADVPTTITKGAPDFCAVYVISKDKVYSSRPANRPASTPPRTSTSSRSSIDSHPTSGMVTPMSSGSAATRSSASTLPPFGTPFSRLNHLPSNTPSTGSEDSRFFSRDSWRSDGSDQRISFDRSSEDLSPTTKCSYMTASPNLRKHVLKTAGAGPSFVSGRSSGYNSSVTTSSFQSAPRSGEYIDHPFPSKSSQGSSQYSRQNAELEAEMTRLRLQLKQTMELFQSYSNEADVAKEKAVEQQERNPTERRTSYEAKVGERAALAMLEIEKQKYKVATEAAEISERLAEMETEKRKIAEQRAKREENERKRATDALSHNNKVVMYQKYTLEEIEAATDYFSTSAKIGEGGYGPVYKAMLNHTSVAIKVLRPDVSHGLKQFQQEIEVLSSMRHPNMVLLLGACPEYGCLVYEYMENGSLEDRLFCKGKSPPLPWQTRFKIASEIATALLFLHQAKPEPLVHRDLKPANILLDHNFVGKISDVGLARLLPSAHANNNMTTQYHMTAAAGTFCYIDPEYQQTGMLSVKSDIYSLGVMFLQMITAKQAMGLSHMVETAIENGTFQQVLDPAIDDWPVEAARSFAQMSLTCCELRKKDRPDLATVILPELIRLRDLGRLNNASRSPNIGYVPSQLGYQV